MSNEAKNKTQESVEISLKKMIDSLHIDVRKISLLIDKSDYRLSVMANSVALKKYPVVFGFNPLDDKLREGDGCTPEGTFNIRSKYPHKSWSKFMWLDYPNDASWKKHNAAIKKKLIDSNSGIGGDVGIHGVPVGTDYMIDKKTNWTLGCISLRNENVNEIYEYVKAGTVVIIRK